MGIHKTLKGHSLRQYTPLSSHLQPQGKKLHHHSALRSFVRVVLLAHSHHSPSRWKIAVPHPRRSCTESRLRVQLRTSRDRASNSARPVTAPLRTGLFRRSIRVARVEFRKSSHFGDEQDRLPEYGWCDANTGHERISPIAHANRTRGACSTYWATCGNGHSTDGPYDTARSCSNPSRRSWRLHRRARQACRMLGVRASHRSVRNARRRHA